MKKNKIELNKEETEILEFMDNLSDSEVQKSKTENKKEIDLIKKSFSDTKKELEKRKTISLRVPENDIRKVKEQAKREGIPYQTLIVSLIHKMANSKIEISLK